MSGSRMRRSRSSGCVAEVVERERHRARRGFQARLNQKHGVADDIGERQLLTVDLGREKNVDHVVLRWRVGPRRHRVVDVLIQPAPCGHARFLRLSVQRRIGQLDTQRDIVGRHAEEVLEEDDAGLPPCDLGEIARAVGDEGVDESVRLVTDLRCQRLHPRRREVGVEHLAELLLPWRVKRDDEVACELFGRLRCRIAGEVLPVLQDLVAVRIPHRHPGAAGCGGQKRNVGVGERGSVPHHRVDVVEEVVVVEILVAEIPVLRVLFRIACALAALLSGGLAGQALVVDLARVRGSRAGGTWASAGCPTGPGRCPCPRRPREVRAAGRGTCTRGCRRSSGSSAARCRSG